MRLRSSANQSLLQTTPGSTREAAMRRSGVGYALSSKVPIGITLI